MSETDENGKITEESALRQRARRKLDETKAEATVFYQQPSTQHLDDIRSAIGHLHAAIGVSKHDTATAFSHIMNALGVLEGILPKT